MIPTALVHLLVTIPSSALVALHATASRQLAEQTAVLLWEDAGPPNAMLILIAQEQMRTVLPKLAAPKTSAGPRGLVPTLLLLVACLRRAGLRIIPSFMRRLEGDYAFNVNFCFD
jgi:hypothetical protein